MIVQSAPPGEPAFVITMRQHTAFAGALARAFGNDEFEPVRPRDEMLFVVDHHDEGWAEYDREPKLDPATRLPYHLIQTPREVTVKTGVGSAEFNEAHHPYCGLLSSMHIWGLYNGRYGYSDQVLISTVPEEYQLLFQTMLDGQLARQERLKATLAEDPETASWVEERHLFQNYKQLQFFDTLALYFHCAHEGSRQPTDFLHVPKSADDDVTVTVAPLGDGVYRATPFPFVEDGVELTFEGRSVAPFPPDAEPDLASAMYDTPVARQVVRFVA